MALAALLPSACMGQDMAAQPAAILHTQGGVWVNGYEAKDSSTVFEGDMIETKTGFSGSLTLEGSSVAIGPETVGKFQKEYFELGHGAVSVGTSKGYQVHLNCLRVIPVHNQWTQYEVTDVNRTLQVAARKDDVNVDRDSRRKLSQEKASEASEHASVHEGEQKSYSENDLCGAAIGPAQAGGFNVKWAEIGGGIAGGLLLCILYCSGGGKKSVSNTSP